MLKLNQGVTDPTPLKKSRPRDLAGLASKEIWICLLPLIFSLPSSLSFTVVTPLNSAHLDALVPSNPLRCLQNLHRMLSISQIFLHIDSIQWCLLLGYSQTSLQLRYMEDIMNS